MVQLTDEEQLLPAKERQAIYDRNLAAAVQAGGCPKCGSMSAVPVASDPHLEAFGEGWLQCHGCGNKFKSTKQKETK